MEIKEGTRNQRKHAKECGANIGYTQKMWFVSTVIFSFYNVSVMSVQ